MADDPAVSDVAPVQINPTEIAARVPTTPTTTKKADATDKTWDDFTKAMGEAMKGKKVEEPKEVTPEPEKKPEVKKEEPPKPEVKKVTKVEKRAKPPEVDVVKVASDAASQAAAAVAKEFQAAPKKEPEVAVIEVSEDDKPIIEVLEFMASKDATKKPLVKQYNDFMAKERTYRADWQKENPGKKFDPDASDHEEFYEANAVDLGDASFRRAETQMVAERATAEATKKVEEKYNGELDTIKRERALERIQPEISARGGQINHAIATELGEEVAKTLASDGGFGKLSEEDPISAEALNLAHQDIAPVVTAVITIYDSKGHVRADPKNEAHVRMGRLINDLESVCAQQSLEDRTDEKGNVFATLADYTKMTPEQQSKHWVIGKNELLQTLEMRGKAIAKGHKETRLREIQKYLPKGATAIPNGEPAKKAEVAPPAPKPKEPSSIAGGAKVGTSSVAPIAAAQSLSDVMGKSMFGR